MPRTFEYTSRLVIVECCVCGIDFGMPTYFEQARRNDHALFYCPSGHGQHFLQKSKAEQLREKLDREQHRSAQLTHQRDQAYAEAGHQRARATGYKGHLTRTKKRIANGVCPCCNRSFVHLARHMASQHPAYAADGQTDG